MRRSNFFYKLFNYNRNNSSEITKYNSFENFDYQKNINERILEIDREISENSKALLEAQLVKLKSTFYKSNNFIKHLGTSIYKAQLEDSINWHQKKIRQLYTERKQLQIYIEKKKGIYWINQIKRFLEILSLGFLLLFFMFIMISSFMIIINLIPIILIIILGYWIVNKNIKKE